MRAGPDYSATWTVARPVRDATHSAIRASAASITASPLQKAKRA